MTIQTDEHHIELFDDSNYLVARLTFFQLPSHQWVLEQIFFAGRQKTKYIKVLIEEFLKSIPVTIEQVMILDPAARIYINEHFQS